MAGMSSPRFFALVPAAGIGERSGAGMPKQYVEIAGMPMLGHTLAALAAVARLSQTLVVLSPADDRFEAALPGYTGWLARVGGASRAESVLGGLGELRRRGASDEDWVLVHDAARCLLRPQWVDALIDACQHDAVGGLLAQPVADTLKAGDAASRVTATVDRRDKWAAQTPQMFRLDLVERRWVRQPPTKPAPSRRSAWRRAWCGPRWPISRSRGRRTSSWRLGV
jgi:2-C-methyl-D-erythritol 4-phosphate cytidylyltransferase